MDRTVRHLRLRAPSEGAVRRLLPAMEDALRCASLGDDGARVLVVRRLALGRIPPRVSPQALARLIEQRSAEAQARSVQAGSDAADAADCVGFASALDARVQLATRLLQGRPCSAWYWPLAVPEFDALHSAGTNLRQMARAIAGWPEARAALPAWLHALWQAGALPELARALGADEGKALVERVLGARAFVQLHRPDAEAAAHESPQPGTGEPWPDWLQVLLPAAPTAMAAVPAHHCGDAPAPYVLLPMTPLDDDPAAHGAARAAATELPAVSAPLDLGAAAVPGLRQHTDHVRTGLAVDATLRSPTQAPSPDAAHPAHPTAIGTAWLVATAFGGLPFLLPLLQRLGLPQASDDPQLTASVLRAALRRLAAPADDPVWAIAASPAAAPSTAFDEQAALWLTACRHCLRRSVRIGLRSLVQRPARLALSATHLDMHFRLADADLRVRRAGLDVDPGWLPWYGRVVAFHYGEAA